MRLVLEGIEGALRSSKSEETNVPQNLTIEHVLPQGWREHWPLPAGGAGEETAAIERDRLLHSIGNLTLVNNRLNPSLSNGPWKTKREGLNEHSVLFLNKDLLAESFIDLWGEKAIRCRSERLAQFAVQVWPGPKA